ncbi:hypothetical protein CsSME_00051635 [Camellia sinensis var. sinensis]
MARKGNPISVRLYLNRSSDSSQFSDLLPENYASDPIFSKVLNDLENANGRDYTLINGYLRKGNQLCLPEGSPRQLVMQELHSGRLGGHFGQDKTEALVQKRVFLVKHKA